MPTNTDFEFILTPNTKYWFVFPEAAWIDWYKILKGAFGQDSFKVLTSVAREGVLLDDGRTVRAVFLAIKVGPAPILTSAEAMGVPEIWNGESPEELGVYVEEDGHWVVNVVEAWADPKIESAQKWADEVQANVATFGEDVAERAQEMAKQIQRGWSSIVYGVLALGIGVWFLTR